MNPLIIHWDPNPIIFSLGSFALRWYSIFWMIAIISGSYVIYRLYQKEGLPIETYQKLFNYSFVGIFVGARLGHCLFYDPTYFLSHPLEIVLPIHILPDGSWKFIGYAGLASHGGTAGLIIALVMFCRKTKIHLLKILDMMGIAAPIAAGFIRLANLMNSEIIGLPTQVSWAFIFSRVDQLPRHPAQLYEAIAYFIIFGLSLILYRKYPGRCNRGYFFGFCLTTIFSFRFFIEFIKERQVAFEHALPLDMGQLLSIPLILIGVYFMWRSTTRHTY